MDPLRWSTGTRIRMDRLWREASRKSARPVIGACRTTPDDFNVLRTLMQADGAGGQDSDDKGGII